MQKKTLILLLCLSLITSLPAEGGLFRNLGKSAHPWRFNGREFVPGAGDGSVVIMVRDGYLPVVRTVADSAPSVAVPDGLGTIAGICYIQVSGGKLSSQGGELPATGCTLEIVDASGVVWHATTDQSGFFSLPLPAGPYEVRGAGSPVKLTVSEGRTALVALRAGKRMVD